MFSERQIQSVLVVGATSAIGRAVAGGFAEAGYGVLVAGRCAEACARIAEDLRIRYQVEATPLRFKSSWTGTWSPNGRSTSR